MIRKTVPLIFLLGSLIAPGILYFLITFVGKLTDLPRQAYASDWTAVFVIEHIRTTGEWPTGWDDLRDEYDRLAVPEYYAWSFDELQTIIEVDWNLSVSELKMADNPIDCVWLTSGSEANYAGDPDKLIFDYLKTGIDPNQAAGRIGDEAETQG